MSLEISPKTEVLMAARAKEKGLSVDAYLERLLMDADPLQMPACWTPMYWSMQGTPVLPSTLRRTR